MPWRDSFEDSTETSNLLIADDDCARLSLQRLRGLLIYGWVREQNYNNQNKRNVEHGGHDKRTDPSVQSCPVPQPL